jgi:hypothetical protein
MTDMQAPDTSAKPRYALSYGLRLDQGMAGARNHQRVSMLLPNEFVGTMTLQVLNGTADEIKAQLRDRINAFFDFHANA